MIRVSVMYPFSPGCKFDMDFYTSTHGPMVGGLLGDSLKGVSVDKGLGGGEPGSDPIYAAAGHLTFESIEAFQAAFGPHAEQIMGDIPNFTDIQPVIQISEVVV